MAYASALSPIRQLIAGLQQVIDTGKFDQSLRMSAANDELTHLASLFNRMLEKNAGLIRGMAKRWITSPTTCARRWPDCATAENALQSPEDGAALCEALSDSLEESDRVLTILTTLMDISEAEVGLMKLERSTVNLADIVAVVIELYQFVAEDKGITVAMNVPKELTCFADPNRLRQVLVNLLDNALKYTPKGGNVQILRTHSNNRGHHRSKRRRHGNFTGGVAAHLGTALSRGQESCSARFGSGPQPGQSRRGSAPGNG